MKLVRVAFALLAMMLVAGVIVAISTQTASVVTTTRTDRFTTTITSPVTVTSVVNRTTTISVYENVEMRGTCTATSYFVPDTVGVSPTTVTITSGNVTSYSVSYSVVYPGTVTLGTATYSTSTYANNTVGYMMTSTSPAAMDLTVTICTLRP